MVVFGQSCCNREKLLYSGKVVNFEARVVVLGLSGCIRQNCYYRENGCIRAKVVVFEQSGSIWTKVVKIRQSVVIGQNWLYSGKVVVRGQKPLYSGKVVVFG